MPGYRAADLRVSLISLQLHRSPCISFCVRLNRGLMRSIPLPPAISIAHRCPMILYRFIPSLPPPSVASLISLTSVRENSYVHDMAEGEAYPEPRSTHLAPRATQYRMGCLVFRGERELDAGRRAYNKLDLCGSLITSYGLQPPDPYMIVLVYRVTGSQEGGCGRCYWLASELKTRGMKHETPGMKHAPRSTKHET